MLSWLVSLLEWPLRDAPAPRRPAQAIVVLGAPVRADGTMSAAARERVEVALALFHAGLAPLLLVTGGRASDRARGLPGEGETMAAWLRDAGVPPSALWVDPHSATTADNAAGSARLLLPHQIRHVCLVTQRFHARRARYLFRREGLDAWVVSPQGGVSEERPGRWLRWVLREYGAWLLVVVRGARGACGRSPVRQR